MKRLLSLLFMIVMFFSFITISRADNQFSIGVSGTNDGNTSPCSKGNCYSLGTGGVRIALIDQNGNKVAGPIDLWYYGKSLGMSTETNGMPTYFDKKSLRQEVDSLEATNIVVSNSYTLISIENDDTEKNLKGLNNILSGLKNTHNTDNDGNGTYIDASNRKNTRVPNVTYTIMDRIYDNTTKATSYGNSNQARYAYLNAILKRLGARYTADNIPDTYYLQFEPLIMWSNHHLNYYPANGLSKYRDYVFYGTISEFIKFNTIRNTVQFNTNSYFCQADYGYSISPEGGYFGSCTKNGVSQHLAPFNTRNTNEFFQISSVGVVVLSKDKSTIPGNLFSTLDKIPGNEYSTLFEDYSKAYGVGFISLKGLVGSCNTEARSIVRAHCNNGGCDKTYISALASNDKTSKCVKDGSIKSECNALDPQNIKLYNGVRSGLTDACSQIECTTLAQDVFNKYKKTSNQIGVENSDYENYISWLYGIYKENLLVTSFWRDILEKSAPTCSTEKPECPPGNSGSISNCDANTTFSDSVDLSCWQKNIAYNNADNPLDYSAYQTSKDLNFSGSSDDGCKVYCKETVSFDLPNENGSYKTRSSKIFKWGKDNDISNSTFGTMKVKRICQVVQTGSGGVCDKTSFNPVYWVKNKIDTTITLMYNEPVSGRNVKDVKLKANFKDATININGLSPTSANSDNNSHTCAGNCGDRLSKEFTVTANYSFEYGPDLHWYTDEGNGDKLITESLLDKDNMNKYSELGYGLPTEFTSPTVSYTTYNDESGYTWLATAKETQGYMYAVIQNIGTKNNDGTYHFDALIKTKSKDNNTGFNSNGSLTYGCDYSIKNEMFGTECVGSDDDPDYCSPDTSPKGIDVVFRTIELINDEEEISKAFPGMSGNGREKGANWAKLTNDQIVQILNTSIYNKKEDEQMYHITLNVATIQKIRQWNKNAREHGIDPYTDMTSLTDEQNKDDGNDSYGHTGYVFRNHEKDGEIDGKNVMSRFLGQLYRDGDLKTICFTSSGTITNHKYKCQQ